MNAEKFKEILGNRLNLIDEILDAKGKEYSSETDRLHNFKIAARINHCSPVQALWGMATKHLVSIVDMVEQKNQVNFNHDTVDEKVGDLINYLILLEALMKE